MRQKARRLAAAHDAVGMTFKQLVPRVERHHRRIADRFGSDWGVRLMRIDADVAVRVLHHFADRGLPCLGVHDSFVVRRGDKAELIKAMRFYYRERLGFDPVLKS